MSEVETRLATATTGTTYGIMGLAESTTGTGVYGRANATSGSSAGVYGRSDSPDGRGVHAVNAGTAGSSGGFAVYAEGRLKATGRTYLGAPAAAPIDADLTPGSVSLYLDTSTNALKVRVKYPTGTLKTGTIALA